MGLMRGAGSFFFEGSEVGCLLIHGFPATPQEMRPLGDTLARHGFTILGVRLAGHGTSTDELHRSTFEDWVASVERGIEQLKPFCPTLFVIGISLGGTLALYAGATRGQELTGVIAINAPAMDLPQFTALASNPDLPDIFPSLSPGTLTLDPRGSILASTELSKAAVGQVVRTISQLQSVLGQLTIPTLLLYSRQDTIVPPENGPYILGHIASVDKKLIELTDSAHVAIHDYDRERVDYECLTFIRQHLSPVRE